MPGKLYGVSVGPGDSELITVRAIRAIREADVIAVPNIGHGRQTALVCRGESRARLLVCAGGLYRGEDAPDSGRIRYVHLDGRGSHNG